MKKRLGQFYTTNVHHILQGMTLPSADVKIIEPFVGQGDLLQVVPSSTNVECYDIDPKIPNAIQRDTLLHPPSYENSFVLTNPPYLARNKCADKTLFDKYKANDLYKCFLSELCTNQCDGGILILPLNFLCSIRAGDVNLRRRFLSVYRIERMNIFETQVFKDTTYNICCFQFKKEENQPFEATLYPSDRTITIHLQPDNNFTIGGELYKHPFTSSHEISRWIEGDKHSHLLVKCIDDKGKENIGLTYIEDEKELYRDDTPKQTARTFATLVFDPPLEEQQQRELAERFNSFLSEKRKRYCSLFLTNYRDGFRKRISFDLVYRIVDSLLPIDIFI